MAVVTTKAIVFNSLKYGDTSLIVRCFTLKEGLKSYMVKGVLSSKKRSIKAAYFQPLTQLQIEANHNNKGKLNSFKEVRVIHLYKEIHTSIFKQTIVLFLAEVLSESVKEEEANPQLFSYLETAFSWLDTHSKTANFHLLFLLNLTRYLGFYPDTSNASNSCFNLIDGNFTEHISRKESIFGKELTLFKTLLGINFDKIESIKFSKSERQQLLQILIKYFELHLEGFRRPKSLEILQTVFT
ncbi:MAG: DNA repair protein RecO [Flavobacteriaceae bacterium]|nr:DNA repair protein RecO [Flavobacteriaceae bacterium]